MKTYILKIKKYIFMEIVFDLLCTVALATMPQLHRQLFDEGMNHGIDRLLQIVLLYIIVNLAYVIFTYLCMLVTWKGAISFERNLKQDFMASLFHLDHQRFRQRPIGEYISLLSNDITALEQDYLQPLIDVIRSINMLIIYSVYLFLWVDWRIGLTILICSLVTIIGPRITGNLLSKKRKNYQDQVAGYTARVNDLLTGFPLIDSETRENLVQVHDDALTQTAQKRHAYGKAKSLSLGINEFAVKVIQVAAFAVTGILLARQDISFGVGVSVFGYIESYLRPINSLLYDVSTMRSVREVKARFLAYAEQTPKDISLEKMTACKTISLCGTTYQYENFTLQPTNFVFEAGKRYAIIGGNGSGKSTLLQLLKGFLVPTGGSVQVDSRDLSDLDTAALISYTTQHEHLYRDGYAENATIYGAYPSHRLDKLMISFQTKFPHILSAITQTSNAQELSGGERQTLAFLRAAMRETPVVLMDEPFAAVDQAAKKQLESYLFREDSKQGQLLIFVTHDLGDELRRFDEILLMKDGALSVHGSYEQIIKTPEYQELSAGIPQP